MAASKYDRIFFFDKQSLGSQTCIKIIQHHSNTFVLGNYIDILISIIFQSARALSCETITEIHNQERAHHLASLHCPPHNLIALNFLSFSLIFKLNVTYSHIS